MLNFLDLLVIVFMVLSAGSLLALCLMFLVRNPAVGVLTAAVSIAAIVLVLTGKGDEKKARIARILAAASLVVGIANAFLF